METGDDVRKLLEEIRDAQREQLAEYQRVTQQSLELQQRAVARQEQLGRIYQRVVLIAGVLSLPLLAVLVYLLVRWGPELLAR